jgi:hypothetical protein
MDYYKYPMIPSKIHKNQSIPPLLSKEAFESLVKIVSEIHSKINAIIYHCIFIRYFPKIYTDVASRNVETCPI